MGMVKGIVEINFILIYLTTPPQLTLQHGIWCFCLKYIYIQGVPGGMCQTSGECSLC